MIITTLKQKWVKTGALGKLTPGPEVIRVGRKTFFMLIMHNSSRYVILNAHKYENIKKKSAFLQAQISLEYYFPAQKVKMPTILAV